MTAPQQPRTAAARALLGHDIRTQAEIDGDRGRHSPGYEKLRKAILAIEAEAATPLRGPEWLVLYDDYERGTAFITEDADQSGIIADDLPFNKAKNIADEHNAMLRAAAPAALDVERLARALLTHVQSLDFWHRCGERCAAAIAAAYAAQREEG